MQVHYQADLEVSMAGMLTSKLTERSQTTVPPGVRAALGVGPGERLGYVIQGDEVKLVNASAIEEAEDPVLGRFLEFLATDLAVHPERITPVPASLLERARELTAGVEIDHDAPIDGVTAL
jgi:antitoxin PrlF